MAVSSRNAEKVAEFGDEFGVPAHVTLLFPWFDAPLTDDDERELRDVLLSQPSFDVTFGPFFVIVFYLTVTTYGVPLTA